MSIVKIFPIVGILCLQTLFNCLSSTISQYIYAFYLHSYTNSSEGIGNITTITTSVSYRSLYWLNVIDDKRNETCPQSDVSTDRDAQAWAQQRSAELFFWIHLMSSCPVIVMTYILGLYTPKLGKRFVLVLPMLGMISQIVIWLAIIYFHLREFWWFIAAFIVGLSGSSGVLGLTLNLIITENTIESQRSSRFVHLNAVQTAVSAVATFGIGYYIQWRGFIDLYWIAFSLQIISLSIVIFCFKFADRNLDERTPLLSSTNDEFHELPSTNCPQFFQVCTVLRSNHRPRQKTISLLLTLFANMSYIFATTAFAPFLWFLLNTPFCWTSKDIGNYSALGAISFAIMSLIGMQLLTYVGANDAIICMISHVFFCSSCLWTAFARHSWQLYVGLLWSAFSGYQGALTTSMISKWLEPHERNSVFTLVTETNTIIYTCGNALFNWIYARTVINFRNLTFFIAVGLGIVPLILNICLFFVSRKIPDVEIPTLTQNDMNSVPINLQHDPIPHVGGASCIIIRSRASTTTSQHSPVMNRSHRNSACYNETEEFTNSYINDRNML